MEQERSNGLSSFHDVHMSHRRIKIPIDQTICRLKKKNEKMIYLIKKHIFNTLYVVQRSITYVFIYSLIIYNILPTSEYVLHDRGG